MEPGFETLLTLTDLILLSTPYPAITAIYWLFTDEAISSTAGLRKVGKSAWIWLPRIYLILRMINLAEAMESLIRESLSDLSLPFTWQNLPSAIKDAGVRWEFLKVQNLVLSKVWTPTTDILLLFGNSSLYSGAI
ncbi:uncharacterized protein BDR25DRAFT_317138 [Lindgomyces ingoldianus]|uniref:Uncharacterized protein n=1 Tax=Lindgomyces ingoldianus TaxID=673940 RepID=A0ACB6QL86_9PLEO|nr:uncharacterized protein BDR25DRAFT_317138 [Lindgomyces ingoldianus]KAF2466882.1 hypothetical protein BDR25DRAFT_317138 [Lindgomyces ingoldianus]